MATPAPASSRANPFSISGKRNAEARVGEQAVPSGGRQHTGANRAALAAVGPITNRARRWNQIQLARSLLENSGGVVGRAVIHQDQLERIRARAEIFHSGANIRLDLPRFVEARDHHGNLRSQRRNSSTTLGSSMRGEGFGSSGSRAFAGSNSRLSIGKTCVGREIRSVRKTIAQVRCCRIE